MKYTILSLNSSEASVECCPSWFSRLFGSPVTVVTLENHKNSGWRHKITGRVLNNNFKLDDRILTAIEYRSVVSLPAARVIP